MKKIVAGLMMLGCMGFGANTMAAELKIGIVDLQKVIQTSPQMQKVQQALEQKFRTRRDALVEEEKQIRTKMENFKRDSAILSAVDKKDKEREIISLQQKFELEGQQYQRELTTAQNEAMEDFYTKVRSAIESVAKKENYDLILQKDAAPFASEKLDLTKIVVNEIH
jgi:outer membrane protein